MCILLCSLWKQQQNSQTVTMDYKLDEFHDQISYVAS